MFIKKCTNRCFCVDKRCFCFFVMMMFVFSLVCTVLSDPVIIKENNTADTVLVRINTTAKDVTLNITENPGNVFYLKGFELMVKKGLDFEVCVFLV